MTETEKPAAASVAQTPHRQEGSLVWRNYNILFGVQSPYRPIILTVLTLIAAIWLKGFLTRRLYTTLEEKAWDPKNVESFRKMWNGVWKFVIAILVIMAMSGSFKMLGLTAGFIGMILGWSLQQPVTGLAAWLMIVLKKPFRLGDRVVIAGITGDVMSITLTHVILNQVGGSVSGEERSGRGILIPNAILFQHIIINYTFDQEFMLDEVPVRLTFDSDYERAKEILIKAAGEATREVIEKTGQEPFVRCEFLDWGLLVRLRYQTIPARRQELSTAIIEILLREFGREYPRVQFAIPANRTRFRTESDTVASPMERDAVS